MTEASGDRAGRHEPGPAGRRTGLPESALPGRRGLKGDAIGFLDSLSIALASTAPAYSLAAVLGTVVLGLGVQAPAALLVAFVPMLFIAAAFAWLNRADPDCGTTFSWATRAMGPYIGWIGGWAVTLTGLLIIGSLADVGARYLFELVGWSAAADSKWAVMALAAAAIVVLTALTVLGTEVSARLQNVMIVVQVLGLLVFAVAALVAVFSGTAPAGSVTPSASWLDPFAASSSGAFVVSGLLVGVFIYWGWESCVNLTEETRDSRRASGRAAVLSMVVLAAIYVATTIAVIAFLGPAATGRFEDETILAVSATAALGSPLDKLVLLAVVVSALASTQTTILPASRTLLSMARQQALPERLGAVHPRFMTPHVATVAVGAIALAWYLVLNSLLADFLAQTLLALSLLIAFYYSLTGFACVVYFRRELLRSVRNFLTIGVAPLIGAVVLAYVLVRSVREFVVDAEGTSETGAVWLGVAPPLVIGLGLLLAGVAVMAAWRVAGSRAFFERRPETASSEVTGGGR